MCLLLAIVVYIRLCELNVVLIGIVVVLAWTKNISGSENMGYSGIGLS